VLENFLVIMSFTFSASPSLVQTNESNETIIPMGHTKIKAATETAFATPPSAY
jgi:hypothetical protein